MTTPSLNKLSHLQKVVAALYGASRASNQGLKDSADSLIRRSGFFGGASYPRAIKLFRENEPMANTLLGGPKGVDWKGAQSQLKALIQPKATQVKPIEQGLLDLGPKNTIV